MSDELRVRERWFSERLQTDVTVVRWGVLGVPVLVFPSAGGDAEEIERRYPARRYVMVDDKLRILTAMKATWEDRLTTVFVRQGHYASDRAALDGYPAADVTVDAIADLVNLGI